MKNVFQTGSDRLQVKSLNFGRFKSLRNVNLRRKNSKLSDFCRTQKNPELAPGRASRRAPECQEGPPGRTPAPGGSSWHKVGARRLPPGSGGCQEAASWHKYLCQEAAWHPTLPGGSLLAPTLCQQEPPAAGVPPGGPSWHSGARREALPGANSGFF